MEAEVNNITGNVEPGLLQDYGDIQFQSNGGKLTFNYRDRKACASVTFPEHRQSHRNSPVNDSRTLELWIITSATNDLSHNTARRAFSNPTLESSVPNGS